MNSLLIAGSRTYYAPWLDHVLDNASYVHDVLFDQVIEGCAIGVDKWAEGWAERKGYYEKHCPARWDELGKRAGYVRNTEMASFATHAIVVWDRQSRGDKHMNDIL